MATLAEIRAKLREQESRTSGNNKQSGGDNAIYPHWNMAEGSEAVLRFLPDKDPNNTFFWVERAMIKLPFAGIIPTAAWTCRGHPPLHHIYPMWNDRHSRDHCHGR